MSDCGCSTGFLVRLGRPDEYDRAKRVLDQGRHPGFIGRTSLGRWAVQGGLAFATWEDTDAAVVILNPRNSTLMALNVPPAHRGHGLGRALLAYARPNFARVIEAKVPWFTACGYTPIGNLKQGRSLNTQIMVRAELIDLAGRVHDRIGDRCRCCEQLESPGHRHRGAEHTGVGE